MTAEAAIQQFLSSFDIPAYPSSSVPDEADYPYITYDLVLGDWMSEETNMPVNVWYRCDSEAEPNAKVRQMYNRIGLGGVTRACDGGMLWFKRGFPWAQSVVFEGDDDRIKRRYVNINIEFLTLSD